MINKLFFAQQHSYTVSFFKKYYDKWNRVPIESSPHFNLLCGNDSAYKKYLMYSWNNPRIHSKYSASAASEKIKSFKYLLDGIKMGGCRNAIPVVQALDGSYLIIDGNHRASILKYLDQPYNVREVPLQEYLQYIITNKNERYGTQDDIPYQPVYDNEQNIIIRGRRHDLLDRHAIIKQWLSLEDKVIVDYGATLGAALHLALNDGAAHAYHIEKSNILLTSAIRLCVAKNIENIDFLEVDLSKEYSPLIEQADIAFCFSIHKHVKNDLMLSKSLHASLKEKGSLIFETHSKKEKIPKEILERFNLLESSILNSRQLHLLEKK